MWPGVGMATTPGSIGDLVVAVEAIGGERRGAGVVGVDPDPGTEAIGPPARVGDVVSMGEQDVVDAAGSGDRTDERLGVARRVDEEVAFRSPYEPRRRTEGILGAVAAVEDAGSVLDLVRVEPARAGAAGDGTDGARRARLRRQPGVADGLVGARLGDDDARPPDVAEQRGRDVAAGSAVDAAGVDEPVAGGVGLVAEIDAGHPVMLRSGRRPWRACEPMPSVGAA